MPGNGLAKKIKKQDQKTPQKEAQEPKRNQSKRNTTILGRNEN
ncbi:hypothetical protein J5U23_01500 [Saccharolobus shibatae B12]|uniref:Uncharacterized protein n=1 Tax=Saccharolobus shibatae (strain ATCC 51178 / DSM 5389 / JCM 8931 / NBRC 15437 / B12) TaxID=523848 RepID=A0A8F5BNX3_SACSH|nr:hypothetical protein J5U23_01500 [Saccharolobus shibatae B12]